MNSFRELFESTAETEETTRFHGIKPVIAPVCEPSSGVSTYFGFIPKTEFIPLVTEICGKKFLFHKSYGQRHIGFYYQSMEHVRLMAEIGGLEWINYIDDEEMHMGPNVVHHGSYADIQFLINTGGSEWLNKKNKGGIHMGYYCRNPEIMSLMIEAGDSDFVCNTNKNGKHIGFWCDEIKCLDSFYDICIPLMVKQGDTAWVNHTDKDGRHMGFYLKNKKHLDLLIETGGSDWVHHKDNSGKTMTLKSE